MAKLYVNEIGVGIDLDTKLPAATLAEAQGQSIEVLLPDASEVSWTADIVEGTSRIRHTVIGTDLNLTGEYKMQAKLLYAGGTVVRGDTASITVHPNYS